MSDEAARSRNRTGIMGLYGYKTIPYLWINRLQLLSPRYPQQHPNMFFMNIFIWRGERGGMRHLLLEWTCPATKYLAVGVLAFLIVWSLCTLPSKCYKLITIGFTSYACVFIVFSSLSKSFPFPTLYAWNQNKTKTPKKESKWPMG